MAIRIISLDMTKGFDTMSLEWMLLKVKTCGLVDLLCSWLISHLSDHTQFLDINETLSRPQPITSSALQGSVIQFLLFLP